MRGVQFAELTAFLAVARERSFRRAADSLRVSPSAISHTLRALEDRLGTRLLHRTTRSVSLTDAGKHLEKRLAPAFADIEGAVEAVLIKDDRPSGTLRLTVPRVAAQMIIAPLLSGFLSEYPEIRLKITVDDALIDSVAEGYDAGIRLGERVLRDMETVPIGLQLRGVVVGSPAYLAVHGTPLAPDDLGSHRWLNYRQPSSGRLMPWEFARGEHEVALSFDGPLATNDVDLLITAALGGAGLACITETTIVDHLNTGRLVRILDDWCPSFAGWQLYYPKSRHIASALGAFIKFVAVPIITM